MAFDDDSAGGARAITRAAVLQADDPRSSERPGQSEVAGMSQELLAGRWALVDRFEHAGRLYLVARCGFAGGCDAADLTLRERQVLGRIALGHSNKHIGYDLGLAPSTVATHLQRGMRKLGLRSRLQVVGLLAALAAGPR